MKLALRGADAAATTALALMAGATLVAYGSLPATVPIHFNHRGVADGFASRAVGAWLLPGAALATWGLVRFGARVLPRDWRTRLEQSPAAVVGALMAWLFLALQAAVLHAALRPGHAIGSWLYAGLGAFWIGLGLVLPRVRRNPWIGVRTVWTLSSDEVWARTHRFAGMTFVVGGIAAALAALQGATAVALAAVLTSALAPAVQSYFVAREIVRRA